MVTDDRITIYSTPTRGKSWYESFLRGIAASEAMCDSFRLLQESINNFKERERNMRIQYIYKKRKGSKRKVGCMVANKVGDRVSIGFSLCSPEDKFDKSRAFDIADSRSYKSKLKIPPSILGELRDFIESCSEQLQYRGIFNVELPTIKRDFTKVIFNNMPFETSELYLINPERG